MNEYDLVIFGSGFSTRYMIKEMENQNISPKILILNPKINKFTKFGLIHPHGNLYIQHNIRISEDDIEKIKMININEGFKTNLITYKGELPKINKSFSNVIFSKLIDNDITIKRD